MNILLDKINAKASQFISLFGQRGYNYVTDEDLWNKGYASNGIVYSVVNNISTKVASLPYELVNGDNLTNNTDAFNKLFFDKWNSEYGHEEGMRLLTTNLMTFGVAFIQKKGDGLIPDELYVLPNQQLMREQKLFNFYENPSYYDFFDGATTHRIPTDDLIIIRLPYDLHRKRYREALSPLQPVWDTVIASNNRAEAEKSIFENRGAVGIISPKANREGGRMPDTIFTVLQGKIKDLIGGADKANKIIQSQAPVDFTQIGMSSNDLKLIESEVLHVRRIAGAYQYPSQLLGDYQASQYANYKEAEKVAYTDVVLPTTDLILNEINRSFFKEINPLIGQDYELKYKKSDIPVLNQHWSERLAQMPNKISDKVSESLTPEEIESIKLEIGLNYE